MSEQNQEPEVTIDSLDSSLDDLLKAADATDLKEKLSKAYGGVKVEHSGHMSGGKQHGGGLPGSGDMGGLDRMMIAKMTAKLADAGFSDAQITAFMAGKAEDEEEDEGDDDDDEEMEMEGMKGKKAAYRKGYMAGKAGMDYDEDDMDKSMSYSEESFRKSFTEDSDIAEAIDAAPFMEALTAKTTQALDSIQKSVSKGFGKQAGVNRAIAAAMYEQGQLIKSQAAVIDALGQRLGMVERQPLPQRGRTSAMPLHKSMPGEAGNGGPQPLKKSEVLGTLSYLNLMKGEKAIAGEPTTQVISKLESTNQISPQAMEHVQRFLATHPNEADAAKAYV